MNNNIKHTIVYKVISSSIVLILIMVLNSNIYAAAANAKKAKTRIKIEYLKNEDNTKEIKASISAKQDKKYIPLKNINLIFYDQTDSAKLIATIKTDEKGVATLVLDADYQIGNVDNPATFAVKFEGSEEYNPKTKQIEIRDVKLDVDYEVIDSVYTINVTAYEWVNGKQGKAVTDADVYVYVKRIFSLLKIGEGWIQDGKVSIEIPNDLPGDLKGNLHLVTMIPESDDYGTIMNKSTEKWGIAPPKHNTYADEDKRALWEPRAPLWMVITLSILIFGVFYHYFLIMYKLYKIRKLKDN